MADIDPHQLDYNIIFAIKRDGSATASFAMIPVGNDQRFGGTFKLLGARNDTNSMKITLQPSKESRTLLFAPTISSTDDRSLDSGLGRNILQGIEDQLQREGIGN